MNDVGIYLADGNTIAISVAKSTSRWTGHGEVNSGPSVWHMTQVSWDDDDHFHAYCPDPGSDMGLSFARKPVGLPPLAQ